MLRRLDVCLFVSNWFFDCIHSITMSVINIIANKLVMCFPIKKTYE